MKFLHHKVLVVGAGFSGAVIARELAEVGCDVTVIDKRSHVAGNAYDYVDSLGIRVHKYGPHIFHTSNQEVVDWISRFASWIPYRHKVKAILDDGQFVTLPVNAETRKVVGSERIAEVLYKPYTKKMWGVELDDIDPNILRRIKERNDLNEDYFPGDSFQALPKDGYTHLFQRILDHENIKLELGVEFSRSMESQYAHVFNSMPIDEYFDYRHGELPYRSIRFHTFQVPVQRFYPTAVVNFTNSGPYTRATEWKNFPEHGSNNIATTLTVEEPCDFRSNGYERYYPIKDTKGINLALYKKYCQLKSESVTFIGRCGLYAYIDMHQAISSAISIANQYIRNLHSIDL